MSFPLLNVKEDVIRETKDLGVIMASALPPSIDAAAAAAAAAAAGRFDGLEYAENYSRFLVIGGGVSGLSAASHLARCGVRDFKLLEGRLSFLYPFFHFLFSSFEFISVMKLEYKQKIDGEGQFRPETDSAAASSLSG